MAPKVAASEQSGSDDGEGEESESSSGEDSEGGEEEPSSSEPSSAGTAARAGWQAKARPRPKGRAPAAASSSISAPSSSLRSGDSSSSSGGEEGGSSALTSSSGPTSGSKQSSSATSRAGSGASGLQPKKTGSKQASTESRLSRHSSRDGSSKRPSSRKEQRPSTSRFQDQGSKESDEEMGEKTPLVGKDQGEDKAARRSEKRRTTRLAGRLTTIVGKEGPLSWCPWRSIVGGVLGTSALLGIVRVVQVQWCVLSEWSEWGPCQPEVFGAPHCEEGIRERTRQVLQGNCGGRNVTEAEACWMGACKEPDYLLAVDLLPCNEHSRDQFLRAAEQLYGEQTWSSLLACQDSYLCCYPCEEVSDLPAPLRCRDDTVSPKPVFLATGCFSCFAAQAGGPAGCEDGRPFCERDALKDAHGSLGWADVDKVCCFAVGPHPPSRTEGSEEEPALDSENFERHGHKSAFLGILHEPSSWPVVSSEAMCQKACWEDATCYLYTYVSVASSLKDWQGRCVTWDFETADQSGRSAERSWLPDAHAFSGIKSGVRYLTVIVTVRTMQDEGSESGGPFDLLVCRSLEDCEDRSAITLTAASCQAQVNCFLRGRVSHFVSKIAVSEGFVFRAVRITSRTNDTWAVDRVVVDVEGQLGTYHGPVTLSRDAPWTFATGCLTEDGALCFSKCLSGEVAGQCYVDEEHTKTGYCQHTPACQDARGGDGEGADRGDMQVSGLSCAELNWPTRSAFNDDPSVCGASSAEPLPGCSGHMTWMEAKDFCEGAGARLCTREELEADEAAATGCDLDLHMVWSSTLCGERGHMLVPGASRAPAVARCALPDVNSVHARCCADSRKMVIDFSREQRDAHSLPARMRIRSHGGLANWQVVSGTNYKGEHGFYLQSGMLYDQAPSDSQYVEVSLVDVPISPRGGEIHFYFSVDSEPWQDRLHFYIDENEQMTGGFPVSGHVTWSLARFTFPAVPNQELHSFRWRYEKDASTTVGEDVACLDQITIFGVLGHE